jgi:hypothetical protein
MASASNSNDEVYPSTSSTSSPLTEEDLSRTHAWREAQEHEYEHGHVRTHESQPDYDEDDIVPQSELRRIGKGKGRDTGDSYHNTPATHRDHDRVPSSDDEESLHPQDNDADDDVEPIPADDDEAETRRVEEVRPRRPTFPFHRILCPVPRTELTPP